MREESRSWSRDEFTRQLRHVLERRYHHLHPFNLRMHEGTLTRDELQLWVANRFCYQRIIPLKDAAIVSACPERAIRQRWIERIIDHDGRGDADGGLEGWLRLAEAMDVTRDTLLSERWALPGAKFAAEAYLTFCRTRPWLESVAASLTELFAPTIVQERLAAMLKHYAWIASDGLEYFHRRLTQAPRDAEYALALVTERATTREAQELMIQALEFKCDVLWSLLDAVEMGTPAWKVP